MIIIRVLLILLIFLFESVICINQYTLNSKFKDYRVRVKQPISCEKSIQYSGYIDNLITNEHIFFIFLESRFAPNTDPVILSLNGRLGCSSIINSWFETGLCLIVQKSGIETNPFSFNNVASILYIDQPSDVGFSYSKEKKKSFNIDEVTDSIYWFLQCFFKEFKQFVKNDFHIAGTSFGSHFVPSLATRIIRENRYASSVITTDKVQIRLVSVILGNGLIQPHIQQLSNAEYSCHILDKPIFDDQTCQKMQTHKNQCDRLSQKCNSCKLSDLYCKRTLETPFYKMTNLNPYDIRKNCIPNHHVDSCYSVIQDIVNYLNRRDIQTEYGVDFDAGAFSNCNKHVKSRFKMNKHDLVGTMYHIEKLLATNVRILVYAGDMNWHNNWYGQIDWLSKLDWIGQVEFNQAEEKDWYSYVSGQKAGSVKTYLNLAFVKVYNAGLYAIYDQPASMIDLYSRWLMNISLSY